MKTTLMLVLLAVLFCSCSKNNETADETKLPAFQQETTKETVPPMEKVTGLKINDVTIGEGDEAIAGTLVEVHYTGWLYENGQKGAKFDSSVDRNEPFQFRLGAGSVIKGWDKGFAGMKVGGKRELIISPEMGYGSRGAGTIIPPDATLMFEVELLKVTPQ